jgi:probable AcnD-accessory protein PrpF
LSLFSKQSIIKGADIMTQMRIPAVYMRGGACKGVFFCADALPADPIARDRILLRVTGSPDPYGKQIDGMGGGTSSTSKAIIVSRSTREDCDVDYLSGQILIDSPGIDWSGNCGNLTAAVGPFAISQGLVQAPKDGMAEVRMWQANISKRIIAHVPMRDGHVMEEGEFLFDGVSFPGSEIKIDFMDPAGSSLFPTGNTIDLLDVPGVGKLEATLIDAGSSMIFIEASAMGLTATELQEAVNNNAALLSRFEAIRAHGAVVMGLASSAAEATEKRPHSPKISFVAKAQDYIAASGNPVKSGSTDLAARILSMGLLHHSYTGTGAVALAVAAAIPGNIVSKITLNRQNPAKVRIGHTSGVLSVGAEAAKENGVWKVTKASMSMSARRLMEGWVLVP